MQRYNHIKALFFLSIFSLLLLHQVVPHLHHQHEVEHTHKAVTHGDNHNHDHHHDTPENDNLQKGFLDFFLDLHTHLAVSNEILLPHESSVKQLKVKKNVLLSLSFNHFGQFESYDEVEKDKIYHPPNNYFKRYLKSPSLRGPPSIG